MEGRWAESHNRGVEPWPKYTKLKSVGQGWTGLDGPS
jgi:hypothetical protein